MRISRRKRPTARGADIRRFPVSSVRRKAQNRHAAARIPDAPVRRPPERPPEDVSRSGFPAPPFRIARWIEPRSWRSPDDSLEPRSAKRPGTRAHGSDRKELFVEARRRTKLLGWRRG